VSPAVKPHDLLRDVLGYEGWTAQLHAALLGRGERFLGSVADEALLQASEHGRDRLHRFTVGGGGVGGVERNEPPALLGALFDDAMRSG
jgi:hypothetical protein